MPRPIPETSGSIGNFMSKPARGWLHPDQLISKKGVTYAVRVSLITFHYEFNIIEIDFCIKAE